jgi:hypothetical protein
MNWCSIKHKWEYKKEPITYSRIISRYSSAKLNKDVIVPTEVRLCKRCHKKQKLGMTGYWVDWDLTLEEEREIKLKEIGI